MAVRKRSSNWHYYFQIKGTRYRGMIPEARTKYQAEQSEIQIKLSVFEGKYGKELGTERLDKFIEETYLPWTKANKRSWRHDVFRARIIIEYFKGKTLAEISPLLIEKFKRDRRESITVRGKQRSPASVNRELELLSRILSMAVDNGLLGTNTCTKVKKLRMDNRRNRYLTREEETMLLEELTGLRAHLKPIVIVALGTGMRRGEILQLKWQHIDFI
jgi:integrase